MFYNIWAIYLGLPQRQPIGFEGKKEKPSKKPTIA